ncbi:MAG: hypothetical protein K5Q68_20620 [Roseococcus sp.]|nr:hypothetical protein [Roseococcus sp.]
MMDIVRGNLDALVALQAGGLTWDAVAAGLTAQGFTTADGQPITGRNLTGVISSVRRQAAARAAKAEARAARPDRSTSAQSVPPLTGAAPRSSRLAPELRADRGTPPPSATDAPLTEAEIRRMQAERHSHLFKKD